MPFFPESTSKTIQHRTQRIKAKAAILLDGGVTDEMWGCQSNWQLKTKIQQMKEIQRTELLYIYRHTPLIIS